VRSITLTGASLLVADAGGVLEPASAPVGRAREQPIEAMKIPLIMTAKNGD
jgi:hypothetical protein